MPYYNICPHCGERCDCQSKDQEPKRQDATDEKKEAKSA